MVRRRLGPPRGHQVSDRAQGGHQRRVRLGLDARPQRLLHDAHRHRAVPGGERRRHPPRQLQRGHLPHKLSPVSATLQIASRKRSRGKFLIFIHFFLFIVGPKIVAILYKG